MSVANSQAGKTFWISTTAQNEPLTAGQFAGLTYTRVRGIGSYGETGIQTNIISYDTLSDKVTQKAKGLTDAGSPPIECRRIAGDAGQVSMRAKGKVTDRNHYAYKTIDQDGTIHYNRGLISGPMRAGGRNEDFELETFTLGLDQAEVVLQPNGVLPWSDEITADAPFGWWRLDDTALPFTNSGSDAGAATFTALGTGIVANVAGMYANTGKSATFAGTGNLQMDTGSFADSADYIITGNLTLEWVGKFGSVANAYQTLFDFGGAGESAGTNILYRLSINPATGNIAYLHEDVSAANRSLTWDMPAPPAVGQKLHIALTRNTTTNMYECFVDGQSLGAQSITADPSGTGAASKLYVGWAVDGANSKFNGTMDEVLIYKAALSPSRIAVHFLALTA